MGLRLKIRERLERLRLERKDCFGNRDTVSLPKSIFIHLFKPHRIRDHEDETGLMSKTKNKEE